MARTIYARKTWQQHIDEEMADLRDHAAKLAAQERRTYGEIWDLRDEMKDLRARLNETLVEHRRKLKREREQREWWMGRDSDVMVEIIARSIRFHQGIVRHAKLRRDELTEAIRYCETEERRLHKRNAEAIERLKADGFQF